MESWWWSSRKRVGGGWVGDFAAPMAYPARQSSVLRVTAREQAMRTQQASWCLRCTSSPMFPPGPRALSVRCIELHLYTAGGGLTDPGHNDLGSVLTLSVMLSDPGPSERGGRFTTTDALGNTTAHELQKGDAILLCSETVHNVTTLAAGERNALVIELWTGKTNRRDRFA